ncbi:hypothetical protein HBI56_236210 [Parastagonospora nodorum]|uniref:Uncharacterized protein n=1 Tax=Phaeosphaeria nodorum (strain SN15 / ATCC MYA-4574 / FGSC 10173) TaxID=321614 RepID=A0A7U2I0S5_PHANO|nr:hypothetical protein HBH56_243990 [Parastagonospora nodorum]QRC95626.1 hypothetical protein JI435_407690 [Parastagonospora nodorum SN15]KAH3936871.1 hypothetical protein HBH54_011570 [Parastagonospora nodorum]KAH3944093.1 hypothetical protein HBH53_165150 [Parastagonospora nodorum]KAH3967705.1 hypothetical protein HBH51_135020 [Parastagonospora nodorum]
MFVSQYQKTYSLPTVPVCSASASSAMCIRLSLKRHNKSRYAKTACCKRNQCQQP